MMNTVLENQYGWRYSETAPYKTGVGIGTPQTTIAHNRAKAVFLRAKHCLIRIMVGRAGQPQGWPVPMVAGSSNPVRLTTPRLEPLSGELIKRTIEAAIMATTPTKKHPKSAIPQLSSDNCRKAKYSRKKRSKKSLRRSRITGYSQSVAANSATGLRIPNTDTVPQHALKACFLLPDAPHSMVARAGASSEAPGNSVSAGNANPVRATTNGFASVDGSEKSTDTEAAIMATTPTKKHPKSAIPQLSSDNCRKAKYSRKKRSKKSLHRSRITGYSQYVAASSATGIGVPHTEPVPKHAPKACFLLPDDTQSMVGRAGASSEAPGCTSSAGYANPARSTTSEIGVSGGGETNTELEAAIMATTPTKKYPKSAIPQLSYDCRRKIYRVQQLAYWMHLHQCKKSTEITPLVTWVLSYIADDIEDIDKELIKLGLFDEAMGKRRK